MKINKHTFFLRFRRSERLKNKGARGVGSNFEINPYAVEINPYAVEINPYAVKSGVLCNFSDGAIFAFLVLI